MDRWLLKLLFVVLLVELLTAAPVDPKKKATKEKESEKEGELDDLGLEYGRYLQQVVQTLEEDKDFAKKLENISTEEIQSGRIADYLELVKHNVRTKLDELKRIEVDRLRKLVQEQMERTELGLNRKGVKIPQHLDIDNAHTFEISDLKKLIQAATKDLDALDKKRREEFKKYEMEKELKYRESLKNMTEVEKTESEKHHEELIKKHKDHPKVHHPGSKPQLEQVWEEEDHMPREEFNPKTFFAMHDINGDGHLDEKEVEAVLMPEIRKMYDPKNEEDDPAEMEEEYHRMREHIFNETDKDKDGLISFEEFMRMTQQQEFERDEGWKGLDEQTVYSEAELEEYMRQRQMAMGNQYYGDPRMYYNVPHPQNQGMPPHINYQAPVHQGMQMQHPQYQGVPPHQQQYMQGQQHYQGVPPHQQQYMPSGVQGQQQFHQPMYAQNPSQQYPQHPADFHGMPPQQYQAASNVQQANVGGSHVPQQQHGNVPHQVPQQQHGNVPHQVPQQHGNVPHQVPQQHGNVPNQVPQQQGNVPNQGIPQQNQQHMQGHQGGQLNAPQPSVLPSQQQFKEQGHPVPKELHSANEIPGAVNSDVRNVPNKLPLEGQKQVPKA